MSGSSQPAFTPERRRTLQAVVARILPGTDGPGAAQTDVAVGFERAVLHACFRGLRPGIEAVLDRLQSQAGRLYAKEFSACSAGQQDDLLRALERDPDAWTRFVLRALIGLSLEGLLGDPVHGGNRDFKGWEAIGLQAAEVRSGLCRGAGEA